MKKLICSAAITLSLFFGNPAKAESVGLRAPVIENDLENRVLVAATNTALGAVLGCVVQKYQAMAVLMDFGKVV